MSDQTWWLTSIAGAWLLASAIGAVIFAIAARRQDRAAAWDDSYDRIRRGLS